MPMSVQLGTTATWLARARVVPVERASEAMDTALKPDHSAPASCEHSRSSWTRPLSKREPNDRAIESADPVGFTAWDLAASGLTWIHQTLPLRGQVSQSATSSFARNLGRRSTPQVEDNDSQML